jgi:hypothetical protein
MLPKARDRVAGLAVAGQPDVRHAAFFILAGNCCANGVEIEGPGVQIEFPQPEDFSVHIRIFCLKERRHRIRLDQFREQSLRVTYRDKSASAG